MTSALITGSEGFVGHHLLKRLQSDGWRTRTISRSPSPQSQDHHRIDLTNTSIDPALMDGVDVVFHTAAWQPGRGDAAKAHALNVEATCRLAETAATAGVKRFVHLSSTAAMGNAIGSPLTEQSECRPSSLYERTKREGEVHLLAMSDLNPIILRPPMVAGSGQTGGPLLSMMKLCQKGRFPIFGGRLDMAKPLVHVDDLVAAMLLAARVKVSHQVYLITSGRPHALGEIIEATRKLMNKERVTIDIPYPLAKMAAMLSTPAFRFVGRESPLSKARLSMFMADRVFDINKARQELGYSPKRQDTLEMLKPAFDHFRASGQL